MAQLEFVYGVNEIVGQSFDWLTDTVNCLLVKSGTSIASDLDAPTLSGITTLDEYTGGAGYARVALLATRQFIVTGDPIFQVNLDMTAPAKTVTFPSLGSDAGAAVFGILLYIVRGGDVDSANIPLVAVTGGAFTGKVPDGTDFDVIAPTPGWLQFRMKA